MHKQLRREIFSIFTSLTLIFQYVLGIFSYLPAPAYAANPSASLSQWGNEAPVGWQNGNLNGQQADYFEGDSVPYRLKFLNLSVGSSYWVTIEWDTTKPAGDPIRILSLKRAKRFLNFKAKTSIDEGIKKTIDWYLKNEQK